MKQKEWIYFLLAAIGIILMYPPLPIGLAASIVLVPLFLLLKGRSCSFAFRIGYFYGLIWASGTLYWIGLPTIAGMILALLFVPLMPALFALMFAWLYQKWGERSILFTPFTWTALEILNEKMLFGFHWTALPVTQTYTPEWIQFISITGPYGISFWLLCLNVLFYFLIQTSGKKKLAILSAAWIILFTAPLILGPRRCAQTATPTSPFRAALIQGNIDPYEKWTPAFIDSSFKNYQELSLAALSANPDLIIWPETATPTYIRKRVHYRKYIHDFVDSLQTPLLTGSPDYDWIGQDEAARYNAAFLIRPGENTMDRYIKSRLVPFSERVPFVGNFPALYQISEKISSDVGNYTPGDSLVVFKFRTKKSQEPIRFGVNICFESIYSDFMPRFMKLGGQFLVIITNDGWFGNTSGPYQHFRMAVLRAVENRVWVARCANTGISCVIDPFGQVVTRSKLNQTTWLSSEIGYLCAPSFFSQHPGLFQNSILILTLLILLARAVWPLIRSHKSLDS